MKITKNKSSEGKGINKAELLGAIARGWCSEKNSHKVMDSDLAMAISEEVIKFIEEKFIKIL